MADKNVLEKVSKLIKLSHSDNEDEARTAAMQATRLMSEHKLVLVPQDELERVQKAIGEMRELAQRQESQGMQKLMLGALGGFIAAKKGLL